VGGALGDQQSATSEKLASTGTSPSSSWSSTMTTSTEVLDANKGAVYARSFFSGPVPFVLATSGVAVNAHVDRLRPTPSLFWVRRWSGGWKVASCAGRCLVARTGGGHECRRARMDAYDSITP
jgi:hypothetical protein